MRLYGFTENNIRISSSLLVETKQDYVLNSEMFYVDII